MTGTVLAAIAGIALVAWAMLDTHIDPWFPGGLGAILLLVVAAATI